MTIASTPAKIDKTVKKSQVKDCRINHKLPWVAYQKLRNICNNIAETWDYPNETTH